MAAQVDVNNIGPASCRLEIDGLDYPVNQYILRYRLENEHYDGTNSEYNEYIMPYYQDIAHGLYIVLSWVLKPTTQYTFRGYAAYQGGAEVYIGSVQFSTTDVSRPAASQYLPAFYPAIVDQWVYGMDEYGDPNYAGEANCCVASSTATALSILEYREKGTTENYYSTAYIYGNRRLQPGLTAESDGMYINYTLDQLRDDGTPAWDTIPENQAYKFWPDNRFLTDAYNPPYWSNTEDGAETIFEAQGPGVQHKAKQQRLAAKESCHFYDSQQIASLVQANGYALHSFYLPWNFYDVSSSGIVPEPDIYDGGGHTMLIIGWKTISGTKYWICQNSWGEGWGDSGLCYLPMDWGHSTGHPLGDAITYTNWAWYSYSAAAKPATAHTISPKISRGGSWKTCPTKIYRGGSWHTAPLKIFL